MTDKLKGFTRDKLGRQHIIWTAKDEKIREDIGREIDRQITLKSPEKNTPFQLYTDVNDHGIGAILTQNKDIIGIYSRKFNPSEKNYVTLEKELFAILEAIRYFRILVCGRKIIVHTDHKNILARKPLDQSRAERWKSLLSEYDIELKHIEGKENVISDCLSRAENHIFVINSLTHNSAKEKNEMGKLFEEIAKIANTKDRVTILSDFLSHPGAKKLFKTLRPNCYEPELNKITKMIRKDCQDYQKTSFLKPRFRQENSSGLYQHPHLSQIYHLIYSDLSNYLTPSQNTEF